MWFSSQLPDHFRNAEKNFKWSLMSLELGVNCAEHIIGGKFHSFSQEWGAWPYAGLSLLKV